MTNRLHVLGLGGSVKPGSAGLKALDIALKAAAAAGADIELLAVHELNLPLFDPGKAQTDFPPQVTGFLDAMRRGDAFLWCSPAYHGTVSGAVKNALDYLEFLAKDSPPYLSDRPVGLIAAGGGPQAAVNTVNALAHAAQSLRAVVLPLQAPIVTTGHSFDATGRFSDTKMHERLEQLGRSLVEYAHRFKRHA